MKRAVIQLGAGPIQRGWMKQIARTGLVPIIVDRAEQPSGMVSEAVHVRAPIDDARAILACLGEGLEGLEPSAILTSTDLGVATVPVVAEALGLAHSSVASIAAMDDKDRAKSMLARAGVIVPDGQLGRNPGEITDLAEEVEYVIKPVDSSGSRGVRRVRGRKAVEDAIIHALEFSDRFLVEECIDGEHLDVNGFVFDGRFELVSIGQRYFMSPPACVPIYGKICTDWDADRVARVTAAMQMSVDAFGYEHGPVKADAIDTDRGLVMIELAARFHGDVLSFHVAEAAGLAPAALHWLARLGLCPPPEEHPGSGAWFAAFAERAGKIASIDGLDSFRASPGYRKWIPRLGPGDEVGDPSDNRALVGFGILAADGDSDLRREACRYQQDIQVSLV